MQNRAASSTPPPAAMTTTVMAAALAEDDASTDCPLCMEEIDPTDRHFKPCPCGYQVCRFCWNRIRQNENERCPACRRVYTDDAVEFTPLSAEELTAIIAKTAKGKKKAEHAATTAAAASSSSTPATPLSTTRKEFMDEEDGPVLPSRRHLVEVRVTQKNLVYVIGIPIHLADESILKQDDYFGRFGKIVKLVINKRAYVRTTGTGAINNAAAYITYSRDEEALRAIRLVDGKMIDGAKLLRATYGTTKYCAHFLRGKVCPKSGCLYLHHEVLDNEVSTGVDNSASPPASPTPGEAVASNGLGTAAPGTVVTNAGMEYDDRVKSFFERLQKWTRIDDLLNDLSPDACSTDRHQPVSMTATSDAAALLRAYQNHYHNEDDYVDSSSALSFNPFDDPIAGSAEASAAVGGSADVQELREQGPKTSAAIRTSVSVEEIMKTSGGRPSSVSSSQTQPHQHQQSLPKKTPPKVFTTAQLSGKRATTTDQQLPEEKAAVEAPRTNHHTDDRAINLPRLVKQSSLSANAAQPSGSTAVQSSHPTVSSPPVAAIKQQQARKTVSNDNLFSVLSVDDSKMDGDDNVVNNNDGDAAITASDQEGSDANEKRTETRKQKKPSKKDPKKQLEDDLDELLRQVEKKSAKIALQQQQQQNKIAPITAKQAAPQPKPVPKKPPQQLPQQQQPRQTALNTLLSALSLSSAGLQGNVKLEEEAARRVIEMEGILCDSRLQTKEVEDRLRESVVAFLQSMNITLDDDYLE